METSTGDTIARVNDKRMSLTSSDIINLIQPKYQTVSNKSNSSKVTNFSDVNTFIKGNKLIINAADSIS